MCVVSMTGDFFGDRIPKQYPWVPSPSPIIIPIIPPAPSREEFDALKKEVELMRDLLAKYKEYDKKNNEPDCEIDQKMKFLRQVAESVGVDLDEVLRKEK